MNRIFNMILINTLISIIFFIYCRSKKSEESLMRLILTFLFPGGGIIIFLIIDIFMDRSKNRIPELEKMADGFDVADSFFLKKLDVEREVNIVPVKEALVINENEVKRKLIVDSLKGDAYEYREFLKEALKDNDTETSHYAASAVVEIKRKLVMDVQEMSAKYKGKPHDLKTARDYAESVNRFIESGLLDKKNNYKYLHIYSQVLQGIIRLDHRDKKTLERKINCDIKRKEYDKAIMYCNLLKKLDKRSLRPYMLLLKIYYELGNVSKFNEVLEFMKGSRFRLERKALGNVRFWIGGREVTDV